MIKHNLDDLLANMKPVLHAGRCVFFDLPAGTALDGLDVIASVREGERLSRIVAEVDARDRGWEASGPMAWITLTVHSGLQAVGFTAAFSAGLAGEGLSCNVVAGSRHDHLFVPFDQAAMAMDTLLALADGAAKSLP